MCFYRKFPFQQHLFFRTPPPPMLPTAFLVLFTLIPRPRIASRSPIEVTIFKPSSRECVFFSRRSVQTHRGLDHAPFVLEQHGLILHPTTGANHDRDIRFRLYFYEENENLAYHELAPHCGEDFATTNRKPFQTPVVMNQLDDMLLTIHHEGPREHLTPPPLEIRPLFISGPSENRVDLVFFSDGC